MLRNYRQGCVPPRTYQKPGHRIHDSFFHQYTGKVFDNQDEWICAQFCPHSAYENRIAYGSDTGNIGFGDARKFEPPKIWKNISNLNMINRLKFIPSSPTKLIAAAGDGNLYLLEPECGKVLELDYDRFTDMGVIKSISFHKDEPYVFAVGNKCGNIFLYDTRNQKNENGEVRIFPKRTLTDAHCNSSGIESVVHISKDLIASASSDSRSGIRFWDLRYQKGKDPLLIKTLPENCNVYDMCIDRSGDKLYALTSAEKILEYDTGTEEKPTIAYKYPRQRNFKVNLCHSPISDHLLVGNAADAPCIYDLQKQTYYGDLLHNNQNPVIKDYTFPRFKLPSTVSQNVYSFVDWSCNGRYMLNVTPDNIIIMDNEWPKDIEFTPIEHNSKDSAVETKINGRPIKLERLQYHEEYAEKIKDQKSNYTIARRIGLKEADMNIPINILKQDEERAKLKRRQSSSSQKMLDSYFSPPIFDIENYPPLNPVAEMPISQSL
jgi:hypothetical protein